MRIKPHSLLTSIHIGEHTKLFRKSYTNSNNLLTKVTNAAMYGTHSAKVESFTLETLYARLASQETVFIMGYPATMQANDSFYVIKKEDFLFKFQFEENLSPPYIRKELGNMYATRTKDTFSQSHITVFDYDASNSTPSHLRFTQPADLMHYLAENVHSEFGQLSYVSTYSSSAGIYSIDGTMLKDTARFHIYFFVKEPNDISRFKSVLEGHLLSSNSYWNEVDKNGKDSVKLLLDLSVLSPERLVFETIPKIDKHLTIAKPEPVYHQGTVEEFDTLLLKDNFSSEQIERFAKVNQLPVKVAKDLRSVTGIKRDFETFKYSTLITLSDGSTCTCEDLEARLSGTETISCYSPFRDENNPSCFVSMNSHQGLFLHDMAEKISYFCCEKPLLALYPLNAMLPVEVFSETTMVNNKKVPLAVTSNVKSMLDSYGITVRYNQMSRSIDTVIPNLNSSVDNQEERSLIEIQDLCVRSHLSISKDKLCGALLSIADENRYHPVKEWILSKDWDGEDRFQMLCDTVQVKPEYKHFWEIVLLKVLQAIVAGAFEENGNRFEYVLVFSGKQGLGKTSWLSRLLPEGMVFDGCGLDLKDKDSIISAVSYAITELGEIDSTFKKSDMSALKAFLSKKKDDIRVPYARTRSPFPRRNVFVGSVNDVQFLSDNTGNRRFWTIHVEALNYLHKIDMQQVFAQVYLMNYLHNDPLHLNKAEQELHEQLVKHHELVDPLEEKLAILFDFESPEEMYMTTTQVLELLNLDVSRANATRMGKLLSTRYDLKSKLIGNVKQYLMPKLYNHFTEQLSFDLAQNQVDVGTFAEDFAQLYL